MVTIAKKINTDSEVFLKGNLKSWYNFYKPAWRIIETALNDAFLGKTTWPYPPNIFKAFKLCNLSSLKVIIVGGEPYKYGPANGLAFGAEGDRIPDALQIIKKAIDSQIGESEGFDYTLESWAKQGVLLLNCALTAPKDDPFNITHTDIWGKFMEYTFNQFNDKYSDLIFVFLGRTPKLYVNMINNKKNLIILGPNPLIEKMKPGSNAFTNANVFKRINDMLKEKNQTLIKW